MGYSVYALGDSTCADSCGFGRELDEALETASATGLVERCASDLDYQAAIENWVEAVFGAVKGEPVSA